ncbi:MAG: hypothetical protein ACWGON_00900 [Gemmatimonadota bacterium]
MILRDDMAQAAAGIPSYRPVISELVASGEVVVVGGIHDLATGKAAWLDSRSAAAAI